MKNKTVGGHGLPRRGLFGLSDKEARYIEGYAAALQDIMMVMTGENGCSKSYDPMTVSADGKTLHSYAFDLRDGGRHHPVSDYENIEDIKTQMLRETEVWLREDSMSNATAQASPDFGMKDHE